MVYTVKQLSDLAGVSIRTLHYYDEIGLLTPSSHGENRYRYYEENTVLRLQQILFFKELGLGLDEIKDILDRKDFDVLRALQIHRLTLQEQVERLERLLQTVDETILFLKGDTEMKKKDLFVGFSPEKQKQYEQEIRQRYGNQAFERTLDWNSLTPERKAEILDNGKSILQAMIAVMDKGPKSPEAQAQVAAWHRHMNVFYECSCERLLGLTQLYNDHPDFQAYYAARHPDLLTFLTQAVQEYCKNQKNA